MGKKTVMKQAPSSASSSPAPAAAAMQQPVIAPPLTQSLVNIPTLPPPVGMPPVRRSERPSSVTAAAASAATAAAAAAQPAAGRRPTRVEGYLYPLQDRDPTHRREAMGDAATAAAVSRYPASEPARLMRMSRTLARRPAGAKPKWKPKGLAALGLSRNHLVADSNVAAIVRAAVPNAAVRARPGRMHHFLSTLGGHRGADAVTAFTEAQAHHHAGQHNHAIAARRRTVNHASMGSGNLRVDDARRNTENLHGFDHELGRWGRPTERSHEVHAALRGLLRYAGMRTAVFRAGRPTIAGGRYQTSSRGGSIAMSDIDALTPAAARPDRRNSV